MATELYNAAQARLESAGLTQQVVNFALDDSFLESDGDAHLQWLLDAPIREITYWAEHCLAAANVPVALPTLTCLRCGHTWHPRTDARPKVCRVCKSYSWDKPRRTPK
jgi:hypothetical protein